jgi:hypothetical protein
MWSAGLRHGARSVDFPEKPEHFQMMFCQPVSFAEVCKRVCRAGGRRSGKGMITKYHSHHYFGFAETQWKLFLKESPRQGVGAGKAAEACRSKTLARGVLSFGWQNGLLRPGQPRSGDGA